MSETPGNQRLLTAVIPISGMAGKLGNLRETLLNAASQDLEFVFVHDKKDEETGPELLQLINQFPNLDISLIQGTFGNPGSARNAGLEVACGKWIIFWDSDDIGFAPAAVKAVFRTAPETDVVIGQCTMNNTVEKSEEPISQVEDLLDLPQFPGIWRIAFKNKSIVDFEPLSMGEDQLFLAENINEETKVETTTEHFYTYFVGNPSQLTSHKKNITDLKHAIRKEFNLLRNNKSINQIFVGEIILRQNISLLKYGGGKLKIIAICSLLELMRLFRLPKFVTLCAKLFRKKKSSLDISVSLTGGLGNQLFQLSAARFFSSSSKPNLIASLGLPRLSDSGSADLFEYDLSQVGSVLETREPSIFERKVAGYAIRLGVVPNKLESVSFIKTFLKIVVSKVVSKYIGKKTRVEIGQGVGFYEAPAPKSTALLIGYFQSYKWVLNNFVIQDLRNLSLKKESIFLNELTIKSARKKILAVHIRLGDYKSESSFGILGPKYYQDAFNVISKRESYSSIWIFSDEPNLAKKLYSIKTDIPVVWIEDISVSSAETLEAMRLCSGYIIANSSFSWWGAMLSKYENPEVVAPSKWFRGMNDPTDLIPPRWTTINPSYLDVSEVL